MSLNSKYVIAPSLQEFFIDKDNGLPLSGGTVTFYSDVNRAQLKTVYTISGNPPNYSYVPLPNPITLSAVGTIQDNNGNDVLPYFYPYDANGNTELYYVVIQNSSGVPQFTRPGWPNIVAEDDEDNVDITNYVPNGQFRTHFNIAANPLASPASLAGQITSSSTTLAPGGWTFERSSGSTATDFVTFSRYGSYTANPTASPRYAVQVQCQSPDVGDTYKDLRVKFQDVNKFASTTQQYTFSFSAMAVSGSFTVGLNLIKNFGTSSTTGGVPVPSATSTTQLTTFDLTSNQQTYSFSFTFGVNSAESIGSDDNDFIQLAIAFPPGQTFEGTLTDFILTPGNINVTDFPATTDADFLDRGIAGWMPTPAYDGSDLYLPLRLTPSGLEFSHADIGKVFSGFYSTPNTGELLCDGSQYYAAGYSNDGIPYSRLFNVLYSNSLKLPIFGTGSSFVTTYIQAAATNDLFLTTNNFGTATAPADTGTTGFTFTPIHAISASGYGYTSYNLSSNTIGLKTLAVGSVTSASAGTSGFTVGDVRNTSNSAYDFNIVTVSAAALANPGGAGKYFTFHTNPGNTAYYMWFQITNETDPAPGGTGIKVNLDSANTAADVALIVMYAMVGGYQYQIKTTAASSITQSSWFDFGTPDGSSYYVWYNKDGGGTDPKPAGKKLGIEVSIASADTSATVATNTMTAINKVYFAVPDLRGLGLRGLDKSSNPLWDCDIATRFGNIYGYFGAHVGTLEYDTFLSHTHTYVSPTGAINNISYQGFDGGTQFNAVISVGSNASVATTSTTTGSTGGNETRMVNVSVNYFIKY